jgi:hypothetical protein
MDDNMTFYIKSIYWNILEDIEMSKVVTSLNLINDVINGRYNSLYRIQIPVTDFNTTINQNNGETILRTDLPRL